MGDRRRGSRGALNDPDELRFEVVGFFGALNDPDDLRFEVVGFFDDVDFDDDELDLTVRHLPGKHNQKTHAGIKTGSKASDLDDKGRAALDDNNKKWGVSQASIEAEIESKLTPENIAEGKKWYPEARKFNEDLAKRSGLSVEQVTAITSLVSPRMPWPRNKQIAEKIAMEHGKYTDADPKVAAKKMGGALSANMGPAIAVARGDLTPDKAITGIKRRSFYNNMLKPGHTDDVTVDTWMQRSAMNASTKKMELDDSLKYLNASKGSTGGAGAGYVTIADATRAVAKKHGLSPDELQAAYWIGVAGSSDGQWGRK